MAVSGYGQMPNTTAAFARGPAATAGWNQSAAGSFGNGFGYQA